MTSNITSVVELKKAIEREEIDAKEDWDVGFNAGLRKTHRLIDEFEASIKERIADWETERLTTTQPISHVQRMSAQNELRRVLGEVI